MVNYAKGKQEIVINMTTWPNALYTYLFANCLYTVVNTITIISKQNSYNIVYNFRSKEQIKFYITAKEQLYDVGDPPYSIRR
jgi:hypothetical protein